MRPSSWIWRALKWAGTGVVLVLLLSWPLSYWRGIGFRFSPRCDAMLSAGAISYACLYGRPSYHGFWVINPAYFGYRTWLPRLYHWSFGYRFDLPLWIVLIGATSATAVFWSLHRRRIPPGHCQKCGYNLTGNVSGRCPECGTGVHA